MEKSHALKQSRIVVTKSVIDTPDVQVIEVPTVTHASMSIVEDPPNPDCKLNIEDDDKLIEDTDKPLDTDTAAVAPSPHQQTADKTPGSGLAGGPSKKTKKPVKKKVDKKTDGK